MKNSIYSHLILSAIVLPASLLITQSVEARSVSNMKHQVFQKGMCYATWDNDAFLGKRSDESLKAMLDTGANCVQIVVTWYQDTFNSTYIKASEERTPSDKSIEHVIKKAHEYGLSVMLKPHIDLIKSDGNSRGDIGFSSEEDWDTWFNEYLVFIKHYARIAQKYKVEFFCIGTELSYAAAQTDAWVNKIIPAVRKIYSGKITYAANWDSYKNVEFWSELDFAGIDAYFPLYVSDNPTVGEIKSAWEKWVTEIEAWQKDIKKSVVFTECGYSSADSAAKKPWEEVSSGSPNFELQANCYMALMETFCGKPYFKGLYWWKWNTYARSNAGFNLSFSPQNKPAIDCIQLWNDQSIFSVY